MYKNILKLFIIAILIIVEAVYTNAQELPTVAHSNNKVSIDGKNYYIHIVRKGETLSAISRTYEVAIDSIKKDNLNLNDNLKINQYIKVRIYEEQTSTKIKYIYHKVTKGDTPTNIAKRYNIKIDDIYKLNPDSELSIKIGESLKIPISISKQNKETIKEQNTTIVDTAKNYITYKVQKKETKYGIANKYHISVDVFEKINNLENRQLNAGEYVKVPILDIKTDDGKYYYKVKPKETIYSLTKKYDITKREFYKLNPITKERGLKVGELIIIPKNETSNEIFANEKQINTEVENNLHNKINNNEQPTYDTIIPIKTRKCKYKIDKKNTYKVAMFLPLFLNINDTLSSDLNDVKNANKNKIYGRSKLFLEFYEGALLALNDLKREGMSFDIRVFDTQNDSLHIKNILASNNLSDYNLFIGPFYSSILNIVSDYAWENQINIVSPLSLKQSFIDHNPYAFQVSPPFEVQMLYASEYLNEFDTKNYIVIHDGKDINQEYISAFKKELYSQINDSNYMQVKYNEVFYYEARDSVLKEAFTPNIKNIVVVPSNNQAFVSDVIGKINGYTYKYDITTFGQPRWMSFNNIELEHYHNTNTHIFSNSYIDYSKKNVKQFVVDYRAFYKTEPDKYAFQGYDITKYFCSALNIYGHNFRKCIHTYKPKLLQTNFNFVPYSHQGGYQNTAIYILEYSKENKLIKADEFPKK